MKILVIILNTILFLFTLLVMATDGTPVKAAYIVFAIWAQTTCVLNIITVLIIGTGYGWSQSSKKVKTPIEEKKIDVLRIVTVFFDVVALGFITWAFVDQYPHPNEEGFIEYLILMASTPLLSAITIWPRKAGGKLKTT
jgi:hypothetical protein